MPFLSSGMSVNVLPPMSVALCLFLPPRTSHTGPFKNDFDFIYLWLCWAIAALHGLSLVADYRLLVVVTPWLRSAASRTCGLQLLRQVGSVAATACSLVAALRLSCPIACAILVSRPEIEPTSPALKGKFLTIGPPRKSPSLNLEMRKPSSSKGE